MGMQNVFIYTEIVRCGQIGIIALRSFFAHHPKQPVHVFGLESDRESIAEFPLVIFHSLDHPDPKIEEWGWNPWKTSKYTKRYRQISENFNHGHLGTASLWAYLIQSRSEKYLLHFDSDIVFRDTALPDIFSRFKRGYDLVGPVRNYKYNPHNEDDKRGHPDLTQTCFFGFNRTLVSRHPYSVLTKMCQGLFNPLGFPVIDFFDPVEFEMIKNGAKIAFLSFDDYGGENRRGSRKNKYPKLNAVVDFGNKLSHFSAVGSGLNFHKNHKDIREVADSYIQYGLEKYAVYVKLFYDEDIGVPFDMKKYGPLFRVKNWY
jgi:hypothetical protein